MTWCLIMLGGGSNTLHALWASMTVRHVGIRFWQLSDIATLGPTWNPTCLGFLQVLYLQVGSRSGIISCRGPPTRRVSCRSTKKGVRWLKFFRNQNLLNPKLFWTQIFFELQMFWTPHFFGPQIFLDPKYFWTISYFGPKIFWDLQLFLTQIFRTQFPFGPKIFLGPKDFDTPGSILDTQLSWESSKFQLPYKFPGPS